MFWDTYGSEEEDRQSFGRRSSTSEAARLPAKAQVWAEGETHERQTKKFGGQTQAAAKLVRHRGRRSGSLAARRLQHPPERHFAFRVTLTVWPLIRLIVSGSVC